MRKPNPALNSYPNPSGWNSGMFCLLVVEYAFTVNTQCEVDRVTAFS